MPSTEPPHILVLYSNPDDSSRLRLDREQRAVDQALSRISAESTSIRRLQAVSIDDFAVALRREPFEILQFSGHGDDTGIVFESADGRAGELVSSRRLAAILASVHSAPRAIIFLSCFSTNALAEVAAVAPFTVTVTATVDDEACAQFIAAFYADYFKRRSVTQAFLAGCAYVEFMGLGEGFTPVLTRRGTYPVAQPSIYTAVVMGESILVDLSRVEKQIAAAHADRETFLSLLSRKIRVHRWAFDYPRDQMVIPIGPYFGVFSWTSADDPIICESLATLRPDAPEDTCRVWADLLVSYNDLAAAKYRFAPDPASPGMERHLDIAVREHQGFCGFFLEDEAQAAPIRSTVATQFTITRSLAMANTRHALNALDRGEFGRVVAHLETSLTTIHDLVDAMSVALTQPLDEPASPEA